MLFALMYHRAGCGKHSNSQETLAKHFLFFKDNYPIVLPGDPLNSGPLSICLTFDDATFDFYHYVFPLLKQFNIRAVLGVPVHYILENTLCSVEERLSVPYPLMMQEGIFEKKAPFCTWQELQEMVASGLVEIASHSMLHCNLTFDFVDLDREVAQTKKILEEKLEQSISTFIYPFGRVTPRVHEYVKQFYPYSFRIGSAYNNGWGKGKQPLSRICGDNQEDPSLFFAPFTRLKYYMKMRLNSFVHS